MSYRFNRVFFSVISVILIGNFFQGCVGAGQLREGDTSESEVPESIEALNENNPLPASIKKVVVVILENSDFEDSMAQPEFREFAKKGALLSNYYGVTHPSQPNYIALISGSTHGVIDDDVVNLEQRHIGDLLQEQNKTWKVYAEGYPGNCYLSAKTGLYVRKHVPFLSFRSIQQSPTACARVVEAGEFPADLKENRLSDFSLYIPNQNNNGHDTGVKYASHWFSSTLQGLIESTPIDSGVLFVLTFDEGGYFRDNRIYTVLFGAGIKLGAASKQRYTHYNLLATIEKLLGLGTLGKNDAKSNLIQNIWQNK